MQLHRSKKGNFKKLGTTKNRFYSEHFSCIIRRRIDVLLDILTTILDTTLYSLCIVLHCNGNIILSTLFVFFFFSHPKNHRTECFDNGHHSRRYMLWSKAQTKRYLASA